MHTVQSGKRITLKSYQFLNRYSTLWNYSEVSRVIVVATIDITYHFPGICKVAIVSICEAAIVSSYR